MAVFVDAPRWSAHGRLFAHLVTDGTLAELHEFAATIGAPPRAFDLDHYDVPEELAARAVDAGAVLVSRRDLLHAMAAGGTRIPGNARARASRAATLRHLRARWTRLGRRLSAVRPNSSPRSDAVVRPDTATPSDLGAAEPWALLGEALLARWSESHRHYHDVAHLADVLVRLDILTGDAPDPLAPPLSWADRPLTPSDGAVPPAVLLAAWFHDAVYRGTAHEDEAASAELARTELVALGIDPVTIQRVAALVLGTDHLAEPGKPESGEHGPVDPAERVPLDERAGPAVPVMPTTGTVGATASAALGPGDAAGPAHSADLAEGAGMAALLGDADLAEGAGMAALLGDADLGVLAAGERDYRTYVAGVRAEHPDVTEPDFARGRAAVLRTLLARRPLFATPLGRTLWEERARANLTRELETLEAPSGASSPRSGFRVTEGRLSGAE